MREYIYRLRRKAKASLGMTVSAKSAFEVAGKFLTAAL